MAESEQTPLLLPRTEKNLEDAWRELEFEVPAGPRLMNLKKRYYSLSSLNLQNIATQWSRHHQDWLLQEQKGRIGSPVPFDPEDVRPSRNLSVASDLKASQLNPPRRDLVTR